MNVLVLRPQKTAGGNLILGEQQAPPPPTGPGTITSSALTFNSGEPHESAPFVATVLTLGFPPTIVLVQGGLVSQFSSVPEDHYFCQFTNAALQQGAYYGVQWKRTDIGDYGANGFEVLRAT
jgi:hypothetical protein